MSSELHAVPSEARKKPSPQPVSGKAAAGGLHFQYAAAPAPSSAGATSSSGAADSNLLILLHGLGDNEQSFFTLGQQLQRTLPQTAVLSLRAPRRVPLLEEQCYCWWDTFTPLAELIPHQNPTSFTSAFGKLLDHLTAADGCGWSARSIHLLGFGQGATAALEGAIAWSLQRRPAPGAVPGQDALGSIVAVCGGLLSHPTFQPPVDTRIFLFHRLGRQQSAKRLSDLLTPLHRAFGPARVTAHAQPAGQGEAGEELMPRGQAEWDAIIRWWAGTAGFRKRSELEMGSDVVRIG